MISRGKPPFQIEFRETEFKTISGAKRDVLVIHSLTVGENGFDSEEQAINFMSSNIYKVSAHGIIKTNGTFIHFAELYYYTNHAGFSVYKDHNKENGISSINKYSYGIELIRDLSRSKDDQYTLEQYRTLAWLQRYYYEIKLDRVVTHEEIRNNYIEQYECNKDLDGVYRNHKGQKVYLKDDPKDFSLITYKIQYNSMAPDGSILIKDVE